MQSPFARVDTPNPNAQLNLGSWELGVCSTYRFRNVSRMPPWALFVTPTIAVPSADSSPA